MLSLENANRPATMNMSKPSSTRGRRGQGECEKPLQHRPPPNLSLVPRRYTLRRSSWNSKPASGTGCTNEPVVARRIAIRYYLASCCEISCQACNSLSKEQICVAVEPFAVTLSKLGEGCLAVFINQRRSLGNQLLDFFCLLGRSRRPRRNSRCGDRK